MKSNETAKSLGYRQPAEWDHHEAVWLAWPSEREFWQENLEPAQAEFVAFCEAIADIDPVTGQARGEFLNILVPNREAEMAAKPRFAHLPHKLFVIPFGDIWLRDTAPIFLTKGNEIAAACFMFNGWGEKYIMAGDELVSRTIASEAQVPQFHLPWVLEGGSVEVDGEGTCLTSRQCLLNKNRNPNLSEGDLAENICQALGVDKVLWIEDGLINDHTDGHIDTIARYVGPGKVLCMRAKGTEDPNFEILETIYKDLLKLVDARGRNLVVGTIPSPGKVANREGEVMPASYLNFYIGNSTVVVPTYGSIWDDLAVKAIGEWFPNRRTIGRSAKAILSGGGAFHCISQQQPGGKKQ